MIFEKGGNITELLKPLKLPLVYLFSMFTSTTIVTQKMLKPNFKPFFSISPKKPIIPNISSSFSTSYSLQTTPPVRQNALLNLPLSPPTSAYIHLPFCRKRCHYCDFPIVALGSSYQPEDDPRITNYIQLLIREIEATRLKSKDNPPLETVFFGGGTPSLVPPRLVSSIIETLRGKFGVCSNAEISIEMDPGTFDERKMRGLLELGVNRVSLGVQAFQEEMLRACGRAHGVKEVYEALEIIGSCGLVNWSMDLISSLPHLTPEMWKESLELTVKEQPTHVSVYDLQVEQGTKFDKLYTPGEFPLPTETQSAEFYRMASRTLSEAGYEHYEISSYGKKGFMCKHNVTNWQSKSFYAFGLGSASYINRVRFSRPKRMKEYIDYVQNLESGVVDQLQDCQFDAKDMAMDVVMLSLRTSRGLDLKSFGEAFGSSVVVDLCKAFMPYVKSWHVIALDETRRVLDADEFSSVLSDGRNIEDVVEFIRLSDPDGFLLSNELISVAFAAISP